MYVYVCKRMCTSALYDSVIIFDGAPNSDKTTKVCLCWCISVCLCMRKLHMINLSFEMNRTSVVKYKYSHILMYGFTSMDVYVVIHTKASYEKGITLNEPHECGKLRVFIHVDICVFTYIPCNTLAYIQIEFVYSCMCTT